MHGLLRRALADHLVDVEGSPAPANFSLHLAEDGGRRGTKDFHMLYQGATGVVRTRDKGRLIDSLLSYLSSAGEQADDETLRLDVMAFVKDDAAVLAPAEIRAVMPSIERRLNAKGLRVLDRPWARINVKTRGLVVTEPNLTVDWQVLEKHKEGLGARARSDPSLLPGHYPVVGWGFWLGGVDEGPISRALALTLASGRLLDRNVLSSADALERLADLMVGLEPMALSSDRLERLVDRLVALGD